MRLMARADLNRKTDRELAGLKEEFRKRVGNCEQQLRRGYAALSDIRTVQGQRRSLRPNV